MPPAGGDLFQAPSQPPSDPEAFDAPSFDESDEQALRNQELEDELARADEELAKLRDLNEAMREQIADLKQPPQHAEAPSWTPEPAVSEQLGRLAERHPESYQYDPASGISTFDADVFFDTGKDVLRPGAKQLLGEFAAVFREADTASTRIQIDGHTDNQPIGQPETYRKHPTNWHLSIHRAESVRRFLAESGVPLDRMQVAGYSMHRPVASNETAAGRQRNRRVEIRVLSAADPGKDRAQRGDGSSRAAADVRFDHASAFHRSASGDSSTSPFRIPTAVSAWRASDTLRR